MNRFNKDKYPCAICGQKFFWERTYRIHLEKDHEIPSSEHHTSNLKFTGVFQVKSKLKAKEISSISDNDADNFSKNDKVDTENPPEIRDKEQQQPNLKRKNPVRIAILKKPAKPEEIEIVENTKVRSSVLG